MGFAAHFLILTLFLVAPAHEPFADRNADAIVCGKSAQSVARTVVRAMKSAGLTDITEQRGAYFLELPNHDRYDAAHARSFRARYPQGSRRAFRAEVVPGKARQCVAVKFLEDCPPEMAPEGEPRAWHWCGDPASLLFLHDVQILRPMVGGRSAAVERD